MTRHSTSSRRTGRACRPSRTSSTSRSTSREARGAISASTARRSGGPPRLVSYALASRGTSSSKTGTRRDDEVPGRRRGLPPSERQALRRGVPSRQWQRVTARVCFVETVLRLEDLAEREGAAHRRRARDRGWEVAVPRSLARSKRLRAAPCWPVDCRLRRQMEWPRIAQGARRPRGVLGAPASRAVTTEVAPCNRPRHLLQESA
jgi:hypothetical protein